MSEKLSITFSTIPNLLVKADQIRDFAITQEILRRKQFDNIGIIYEPLNEYGVAIDIGELTEEQLLAIKEILSDNSLREFVNNLES